MVRIEIKANKKYASWLYHHLRKEHPSTRSKMKLIVTRRNPSPMTSLVRGSFNSKMKGGSLR